MMREKRIIHRFKGAWWFWDDQDKRRGPFDSPQRAADGLKQFVADNMDRLLKTEDGARDLQPLRDLHQAIIGAIEAVCSTAGATLREGALEPHALLFALRNPSTGKPVGRAIHGFFKKAPRGVIDAPFIESVFRVAAECDGVAVAIVGFVEGAGPTPEALSITLQFLTDGHIRAWTAPIDRCDGGLLLGHFEVVDEGCILSPPLAP